MMSLTLKWIRVHITRYKQIIQLIQKNQGAVREKLCTVTLIYIVTCTHHYLQTLFHYIHVEFTCLQRPPICNDHNVYAQRKVIVDQSYSCIVCNAPYSGELSFSDLCMVYTTLKLTEVTRSIMTSSAPYSGELPFSYLCMVYVALKLTEVVCSIMTSSAPYSGELPFS